MQEFKTLIDKASKMCGSDAALARRMGVHQPSIAEMRSGKRKISPVTAAELADIAGEDAREAALYAVIESARGTRREVAMREILGKVRAAGEAAMLGTSYRNGSIESMGSSNSSLTTVNERYLVSKSRTLVRNLQRWAGNRLRSKSHLPASGSPIPA